MSRSTSEFLRVAEQVLRTANRSLTIHEIYDLGVRRGLFSDSIGGKTPTQTLKSKLSVHIRKYGATSTFVRTAAGKYALRDRVGSAPIYAAPPFGPSRTAEYVLTAPAELVSKFATRQGLSRTYRRVLAGLERNFDQFSFTPRSEAESVVDLRQVLVYVLVTRREKVLAYQRGVHNYTDAMLRGAQCVGFGGHVNSEDHSLFTYDTLGLFDAARRELLEEIRMPVADRNRLQSFEGLKIVGYINDGSSDVGLRHLAFVLTYECSESPEWDVPRGGERSINQLRWLDPNHRLVGLESFEYWSQLCLSVYFPRMVPPVPTLRFVRKSRFPRARNILIIGQVGSGKTEAARSLSQLTGASTVNTGQVVADLLHLPPVPATPREQFQAAAAELVSTPEGAREIGAAVARRVDQLHASGSDITIVDGLRRAQSIEGFFEVVGQRTATIYVHAPPNIAFEWFKVRERPGISMSEFLLIRNAPVEADVPALIGRADAVLYNWRGSEDFVKALSSVVDLLG